MRDDSNTARAGQLRAALADIATLHDATFDPPRDPGRGHTAPASKPPLPTGPLSVRHDARLRLVQFVQVIADRRTIATRLNAHTPVPALANWVSLHSDWIAEQRDLSGRVLDIEEIARDVRAAAEPLGIRRAKVAPCPHCAGTLYAWIDDQQALPGRIVCNSEGHTWDREKWKLLGRVLDQTPDLLDATQLARWLSTRFLTTVEPATVWQWAKRGHIRHDTHDLNEQWGGPSVPRPRYDKHAVADWYLEHRSRRAG